VAHDSKNRSDRNSPLRAVDYSCYPRQIILLLEHYYWITMSSPTGTNKPANESNAEVPKVAHKANTKPKSTVTSKLEPATEETNAQVADKDVAEGTNTRNGNEEAKEGNDSPKEAPTKDVQPVADHMSVPDAEDKHVLYPG
jgi:hypothetical protein